MHSNDEDKDDYDDDKAAYTANKQQVESLIGQILAAGLDPDFLGRPYFTFENLEKVQGALHTDGYMTGLAMRIIEERKSREDSDSTNR